MNADENIRNALFFGKSNYNTINTNKRNMTKSFDKKYVIGRTMLDAPDIDGVVYIKNTNLKLNEFITCKITDFRDYDLVGEIKLG